MVSANRLSDNEAWYSSPYFPIVFKKAGFNVSMWDNQRPSGADVSCFDYALGSYMYAADVVPIAYNEHNTDLYDYDYDMLSTFCKIVNRIKTTSPCISILYTYSILWGSMQMPQVVSLRPTI